MILIDCLDKYLDGYFEIGLFSRTPKIGEKNPCGELQFKGYKRQMLDEDGVIFRCDENQVTVISAVVLDRNNVVVEVIKF